MQTMAISNSVWTDEAATTTATWVNNPGNSINYWYTPWYQTYSPSVTLTLTEVEHLRKLAKKDSKLRKTLKKFTPYIAVEVDFPGEE